MGIEYKKIHCRYHEETSFGAGCSAPDECIYNPTYQITIDNIKGCRVNGTIDHPEDIPQSRKKQLSPEDLVTKITITINQKSLNSITK